MTRQSSTISTTRFRERFWQKRATVVGLGILISLVLFTMSVSSLSSFDPNRNGDLLNERDLPPSVAHPFGTDKFARDLLCRVAYGGQISLSIASAVVFLSLSIGVLYGITSGYFGGLLDTVMMRLLDFLLAFPIIFLVLALVAIYQPAHWYLIPLLAMTSWMDTARIIRSEVLSVKEREFILAAKGLGFSHARILFYHLLPNCLSPALVSAPFKVGEIILLESALSFLGLGVQPPTASWGSIINDGHSLLLDAWWISAFPGVLITLTVSSLNLLGDGLRYAFNPRE